MKKKRSPAWLSKNKNIFMCLGHLKMTYLRCLSDPDDDMRTGLVLIRLTSHCSVHFEPLVLQS